MASNNLSLDDHQKFVLMKFRRTVSDITSLQHDDKFLLRWLKARSWDSDSAEKMLRQSMKWRQQWGVDEILKTWQPPENFIPFYPFGTTGYDKHGSPVIIVPFGNLDIVGILHAFGREVFIKMTIKALETIIQLANEKNSRKVVVIFDMDGFLLRHYAWRPASEVIITLVKMYEANYPEILSACYIINAPKVFAIAFNVIKAFLNEHTLGKIYLFKNDSKKWKKAILEHIEPENLPAHYGGSLTDPDGNPKYTSVVSQAGKVPKHLYRRDFDQSADSITTQQFTSTVIKKGDKLSLDFIVAEDGCFLKWDFSTVDHDIRFGITMKDADGNQSLVVRHKRVAAHQINETGVIPCQAPATYTVTFDNSYSLLRSKKLKYEVVVTPSTEKLRMENEKTDGTTSINTPSQITN